MISIICGTLVGIWINTIAIMMFVVAIYNKR